MKSVIEMVSDIRDNVVEFDDIGRGLHTVKPDCCPKKNQVFHLCQMKIKSVIEMVTNIRDNGVELDGIKGRVL